MTDTATTTQEIEELRERVEALETERANSEWLADLRAQYEERKRRIRVREELS